jgi:DNA helicase-2/ATP-dependent DNA helicase PcrA
MDTKDEREEYVTLMTIHTSKWLEEKRVFLTWLEDWIFPSFRSTNDTSLLEEERRLMYVWMTRAEEELYISRAKERFHFWDYVRNPESRFLKEVPREYMEDYDISNFTWKKDNFFWNNFWSFDTWMSSVKSIKKPATNNNIADFKVWDRLQHPKFGNWVLVSLSWEIWEIAFSWRNMKKMNIRIAPVRKI